MFRQLFTPLFVPGNRPQLFAKAATAGADAIIFDLEDAVSGPDKVAARDIIANHDVRDVHVCVRMNAVNTEWFDDDVKMVASGRFASVMVPKCEKADQLSFVRDKVGPNVAVIALIESARGVADLRSILPDDSPVTQLAFGSVDFSLDVGCDEGWESLLYARSEIVLQSRSAGLVSPLDGVTKSVSDVEQILADARQARSLGFGGKLLIHPTQIAPAREAFLPSADVIAWAKRVVTASADGNASQVDGMMIDLPVILRAQRILETAMAHEN